MSTRQTLTALNRRGAGVFVTVNEADGRGRESANMIHARAVWQELDRQGAPLPAGLDPHIIVQSSPGKEHRYYLAEPGTDWALFEGIERRLVADYGSDPNAMDRSRVLRLPGFYHLKNPASPHLVRIIHESGAQPYTWARLAQALPQIERAAEPSGPLPLGQGIANEIEVRSALAALDPDLPYGEWLAIGMALHHATAGGDLGYRFGRVERARRILPEGETAYRWASFGRRQNGRPVTLASMFKMASAAGWRWKKADPLGQGPETVEAPRSDAGPGDDTPEEQRPLDGGPPPFPELLASEEEIAAAKAAPRCIVQDYLYADVAVLNAPGGSGKTTLTLFEAVHIALGMPLYGLEVESPGRVLFVTAEDSREILIARARSVIEALDLSDAAKRHAWSQLLFWDVSGNVCRLAELDDGGNIALTGLADAIIAQYRDASIAVVSFDPAISFGAGERLVNDNEQSLILAARRIVRGLNCCVRFVHHTGKANAREKTLDQYSGRGGSALADGARMVTVLQSWEDADRQHTPPDGFTLAHGETALILARAKSSYHRPAPRIWLKRNGYAFEHFIEMRHDKAAERSAYADQLYTFLSFELKREPPRYHSRNTLEHAEIMPRAALRRALADLELEGLAVVNAPLPPKQAQGGRKTYIRPTSTSPILNGEVDSTNEGGRRTATTSPPYREEEGGEVTAHLPPLPRQSLLARFGEVGEVTAHPHKLYGFLAEQIAAGRRYGRKDLFAVAPALGMSRENVRAALAQLFLDGDLANEPWPDTRHGKTYLCPRPPRRGQAPGTPASAAGEEAEPGNLALNAAHGDIDEGAI